MTTEDFLRHQLIPLAYRQLPAGELFARAAGGDAEAFVALVCLKYPVVQKVCGRVLGPAGPVEDVALEVFVQLWRQRERVRDAAAVEGWLTRTARNLARKHARDQARGRAAGQSYQERAAAEAPPPDGAAIQAEMARRVRRAVAEQSEEDQRVLRAAERAGGDAEAAAELGLPVPTYRVRLHRARQRLRALLKKYGVAPAVGALGTLAGLPRRAAAAYGWPWMAGLTAVCLVGLVGAAVWAAQSLTTPATPEPAPGAIAQAPAPDLPPAPPLTQAARDRARAERAFGPLIRHVESSLRSVTFGNQGGITLRELRHDPLRPSAVFDWVHREVEGGQVTYERRTALELGYDARADRMIIDFYPSGVGGPKHWVTPDHQVILFAHPAMGIKLSFNLPGSRRGRELLEQVRSEYADRKGVLDALVPRVRPGLEVVLGRLVCGNEGRVEFGGVSYCLNRPHFSYLLRHRQVTAGEVLYDTAHVVTMMYSTEHDTVETGWYPADCSHPAVPLDSRLQVRIHPKRPPGPGNPRLPTERLEGVAEAMAPVAAAYRTRPERK